MTLSPTHSRLRGAACLILAYGTMPVFGLVYLPWAAVSRRGARAACTHWARWALWCLRTIAGIETEIRGTIPEGEVLIAAKHQSFLDILLLWLALPQAKFIMKRELLWTPVIGLYAYRVGCVPVNRGKRGKAIAKMLADVERGRSAPGQLVIYSQGTRVAPGVMAPYKVGSAVLYNELGQPCVPVATNAGLFWPRSGFALRPGLAVIEFLDPIPEGAPREAFLVALEKTVEGASDALMAEAGFSRELPHEAPDGKDTSGR